MPDRERGGEKIERVRVIDWNDATANDFLLVSQMTITGPLYTVRPDLIGFVNGLPLVLIEFKKPGISTRAAFDENIRSYKHPQNVCRLYFRTTHSSSLRTHAEPRRRDHGGLGADVGVEAGRE